MQIFFCFILMVLVAGILWVLWNRQRRHLTACEGRLRAVFEGSLDFLLIADRTGAVLEANPAACACFGFRAGKNTGRSLFDLFSEEPRDAVRRDWARWLAGEVMYRRVELCIGAGRVVPVEMRAWLLPPADGPLLLVQFRELTVSLSGDSAGSVPGSPQRNEVATGAASLSQAPDDDVVRQAREEISRAQEAAQQAQRTQSEFLSNMSHEIRTPLNGVIGLTRLLLEEKEVPPAQRETLQTILGSTDALLHIVDELLDVARIEAGELRLQPEPFSPRDLVEKIVGLYGDRAVKKGVTLTVEMHESVPSLLSGDAGRIRQIIRNLVDNAVKFTHDGQVQIRMMAEQRGGFCNLTADVSDTGIGMPPDLKARVFERFTQGDPSASRAYAGTGVGLTVARHLIRLMGGDITVESSVGQGTVFRFNLVLDQVAEPRASALECPDGAPASAIPAAVRILLVEDNPVNQKVATAMLRKIGCQITVAPNGAQALEELKAKPFDLVFMDCQMPVMDGFEATRAIRSLAEPLRSIPVVALTAHALKEDRQKCLDAGMDDYLSKPVRINSVEQIIRRYCVGRKENGSAG